MKTLNIRKTAPLLRRLARREDGVAAVEFALIAPLLVLFLVGTTTATQTLWAHGKVAQTSSVIGDLTAQETELDNAGFATLMSAAPILLEPFEINDLSIQVTTAIACHADPNDIQDSTPQIFVVWSNGWTDGEVTNNGPRPGSALTDAPTDLSIQDSDYIVRTEVTYTYEPPISQTAGHSIAMEEIAYHQPRDRQPVSFPTREGNEDTRDCNALLNR